MVATTLNSPPQFWHVNVRCYLPEEAGRPARPNSPGPPRLRDHSYSGSEGACKTAFLMKAERLLKSGHVATNAAREYGVDGDFETARCISSGDVYMWCTSGSVAASARAARR